MQRSITRLVARQLRLQVLQAILGVEHPLAVIRVHRRVRTELRQLRLQQHALRIQGGDAVLRVPQIELGALGGLHVELRQFGQLVVMLFFESGQRFVQLGNARRLAHRLFAEEIGGLLRQAAPRCQVLVQVKRRQFIGDLERQFGRAALIRHREGDGRLRSAAAARIDHVGADHVHADVAAHFRQQHLARLLVADVWVQVVALDQSQQILRGHHPLADHLHALIGK
jgi:hypothetical protein